MQAKRAMTLSVLCAALAAASCGGGARTTRTAGPPSTEVVRSIVGRLDLERYKATILGLTVFGDRMQGTQRNLDALNWIEAQLKSYGYTNVERHRYTVRDSVRENVYATKVGATVPGDMYIISAHMDGRGGGEGADDNASGTALVLELARILAAPDVETTRSVRLILWNNGEGAFDGSRAYVQERARLQGIEESPESGRYAEPRWLGVVALDMMLYDHGMPPGPEQSSVADVDIEYQANSGKAQESAALAAAFLAANHSFATDYPAEVSRNMSNIDSRSFQDLVASISLRENQRVTEIGRNSNPHWHKATDVYASYSDADFRLGFNAAQTTLGAIGQLAVLRLRAR